MIFRCQGQTQAFRLTDKTTQLYKQLGTICQALHHAEILNTHSYRRRVIITGSEPTVNANLITSIFCMLEELQQQGCLNWTSSHIDIPGNEWACGTGKTALWFRKVQVTPSLSQSKNGIRQVTQAPIS